MTTPSHWPGNHAMVRNLALQVGAAAADARGGSPPYPVGNHEGSSHDNVQEVPDSPQIPRPPGDGGAMTPRSKAPLSPTTDPSTTIKDLLAADARLATGDRLYLEDLFQKLELFCVADLYDIDALEPLTDFLKRSLYAHELGVPSPAPAKVRAAVGHIVRMLGHGRPVASQADQRRSQQAGGGKTSEDSEACLRPVGANAQGSPSGPAASQHTRAWEWREGADDMRGAAADVHCESEGGQGRRRPLCKRAAPQAAQQHLGDYLRTSSQVGSFGKQAGGPGPVNVVSRTPPPASVRMPSPRRARNDASYQQHSAPRPASPRVGTFGTAGSRNAIGRQTAWCNPPEAAPGAAMYRPSIRSWEDHRPSSPRAVIGSSKRAPLWGAPVSAAEGTASECPRRHPSGAAAPGGSATFPAGQVPGCTGAPPHAPQAPAYAIGSAARFCYGSRNRQSWLAG